MPLAVGLSLVRQPIRLGRKQTRRVSSESYIGRQQRLSLSTNEARATLLDHLVGATEQSGRHRETERFGRLEIEDELEFHGGLDGKVRWTRSIENAVDIACDAFKQVRYIYAIRY